MEELIKRILELSHQKEMGDIASAISKEISKDFKVDDETIKDLNARFVILRNDYL